MMQDIRRRYVRVINTIHGRSGSLWEGRFRSSLIDSETYLLNCHRYIEANPVRANMVVHPSLHQWSSHAHYIGTRSDPVVTEHSLIVQLGRDAVDRRAAFRLLADQPLADRVIDEIRTAINTDSALGCERFLEDAEAVLGRSVRPPTRGRPRKSVTEKLL